MSAEEKEPKLEHVEDHLFLEQPLLRLPLELLKKNFRSAHYEVEKDSTYVKNMLKETATSSMGGRMSQDDTLRNLDAMLARMRTLKRKMTTFADDEARLHVAEQSRVRHLADLDKMASVDDVLYEQWSRTRLDRLLVEYMLRRGHIDSAQNFANARGIEDLVDVDVFEQMTRIRNTLLQGSVAEALAWCMAPDTKKELRKMNSNLEFMLRFQQYIEMVKKGQGAKPGEALAHARKYLLPYKDTYPHEVRQACGMLAIPPGTAERVLGYRGLYESKRWVMLADLFTTTHNTLLALPSVPLLQVALQCGLSALKTPACHSEHRVTEAKSVGSDGTTDANTTRARAFATAGGSVCPICSTELNEIARHVPYALHSKSHTDNDLVVLPNGRCYGMSRLEEHAEKAGLYADHFEDLRTGEVYTRDSLRKLYIS